MNLKEKEQVLFKEWKSQQGYTYFISDGIMDEEEWNKQNCKILFVLKEANWENGDDDLCRFLLCYPASSCWKTWNNVARWAEAILEGKGYPRYVSQDNRSYWLRKVAAMNLKKVGGDAVAENDTIYSFSERDRVFLKRQIQLYEPDIIICCGRGNGKNADILHDVIFSQDEVSEWQEPILQYNYFLAKINDKVNVPVVSFYHPQMRGGHKLFEKRYEEMKYLARELKKIYNF